MLRAVLGSFTRSLHRNRRHLAVAAVCAAIALVGRQLPLAPGPVGIPWWFALWALHVAIVTALASLVYAVVGPIRVGVTLIILILGAPAALIHLPALSPLVASLGGQAGQRVPLLVLVVVILCIGATRLRGATLRARATSRLPIGRLWDGLTGLHANPSRFPGWPGFEALAIAPLPGGGPQDQIVTWREHGTTTMREERRIARAMPGEECVWQANMAETPPGRQGYDCAGRLTLTPHGPKTRIEETCRFESMPVFEAVARWLDDAHGRALDHRLAGIARLS